MKIWTILIAVLCLMLPLPARAEEPEALASRHIVLMDAETGQVLYQENMLDQAPPASITKVMTGLLVMEQGSVHDEVTASGAAVDIPYGSTTMGLLEGETMTVDEAMYAMMLRSANDAANMLGEYIAGSQEAFADLMNERARQAGAYQTSFANASGLPGRNHYTTAYDMALITREAVRNSQFLHYFGYGQYTMAPTNQEKGERIFTNGQVMLLEDSDYYNPDVIGGKVGYTQEARHTMVTAAARDGRTLICVVMNCGREEKFTDTQALLDYGFNELYPVEVTGRLPEKMTAPILEAGEVIGEARYTGSTRWTLLLPAGYDAGEITVEYRIPEREEKAVRSSALAVISLPEAPEPHMSAELLRVPLDVEMVFFEPPAIPAMAVGAGQAVEHSRWSQLAWVGIGIGGVSLLAVILLLLRNARLQRMRRLQAARGRRYASIR